MMDIAYLSASAALAGSVVGGMTTALTTWLSQRVQARAGQRAHDLLRRQELLTDFIMSASKVYGDALVSSEPPMQEVIALYALVSRMRVLCTPRTVACADKVILTTIETFFAPNKTMRELHDVMRDGSGIDPLREFSEAARDELSAFEPV